MSKVGRMLGICKWVLALPFALLVLGPGLMIGIANLLRLALPELPEYTNITATIVLQLTICLAIAFQIKRRKILNPLLVAMFLAMIAGNTICSVVAGKLTYDEYRWKATYREIIGPLGGPDLLMPKPGADVTKVEIEMLRGHRTEEAPTLFACTNRAAIRGLLVALQQGRKVEDHKCSSEGVIYLRSGTNTSEKVEFLAGHAYRYYEYRHAKGIYKLPKSAFFSALSGMGFDTQVLSSPSLEGPNTTKQ